MKQHQTKTELVNTLVVFAAAITACVSGCASNSFDTPLFSYRTPQEINQASASVYGIDQLERSNDQLELVIDEGNIPISMPNAAPQQLVSIQLANSSQTTNNQPIANQALNIQPISSVSQIGTFPIDQPQTIVRGQSPSNPTQVQRTSYQYPTTQTPNPPPITPVSPPPGLGTPAIGGEPNEIIPFAPPNPPAGFSEFPTNYADIDIYLEETQTGRINFGGAYNSDNGIVGQFTIDERNFDIWRFPKSFRDITDGTAWRGAGQTFRLELVPGRVVQRYLVSFGEPYLFNTPVSMSASAYLFERRYFDWDEQRVGGRLSLGYRLTQDLSVSAGVRAESVNISDPRVDTSPQLNEVLGDSNLYIGHVGLIRDTRDHPFMATEGSYLAMTYNQAFGDYGYSRGDIDYRRYRLMYQRPDGSGRHTVSFGSKLGFSGSDTPVFENYFAGGFSTMRGFDFRGASPEEGGVRVGGSFQWLNSLEYTFPITADDMIKGVVFCDYGTVEQSAKITSENFRVAPGFGFRIQMPAMGIGAPLAFDFAFPVMSADTDDEQIFSFYLGVLR